jgi:hypothetical protein
MPLPDQIPFGTKIGRWTLLSEGPKKGEKRTVVCRCDCGTMASVIRAGIKRGMSTSCGCYAIEVNSTHGASRTPLFSSWINMIKRCTDPKRGDYSYYGGRGITVHESWLDFNVFKAWASQNGHQDHLTIERHRVNEGYGPDNCYWATRSTQAANRRKRSTGKNPYIGVGRHGVSRWYASICHQGVVTKLGFYDTPEEARDARNAHIKQNNLPHTLG